MDKTILVLNAGSSNIRSAIFTPGKGHPPGLATTAHAIAVVRERSILCIVVS